MIPSKINIDSPYKNQSRTRGLEPGPKPDLFITIKDRIFPLHQQLLSPCLYFTENCHSSKMYSDCQIKIDMFEKTINYLYGHSIQITTIQEISNFLDAIDFLRFEDLKTETQNLILKDLQNYDLFSILPLAYRFCLQQLFEQCFEYLENEQFQQMNYNRYDFLKCDFKLFQVILRRHHVLKKMGKITGQTAENVGEIIKQYCRHNQYNEETLQRLLQKYSIGGKNQENLSKIRLMKSETNQDDKIQASQEAETNQSSNLIHSGNLKKLKQRKFSCKGLLSESDSLGSFKFDAGNEGQAIILEEEGFEKSVDLLSSNFNNFNNFKSDDEIESIASKIQTLLVHYEDAYKTHERNFQSIRKNARSMIIHESTEYNLNPGASQQPQNAKLLHPRTYHH